MSFVTLRAESPARASGRGEVPDPGPATLGCGAGAAPGRPLPSLGLPHRPGPAGAPRAGRGEHPRRFIYYFLKLFFISWILVSPRKKKLKI